MIVLDSGIWISAMRFGGMPAEAVLKAIGEDRVAVCERIEEEIVRMLERKFAWEPARIRNDLAVYWRDALQVSISGAVQGVCRDPDDDVILECAMRAAADCIVTGDSDLLALRVYEGIPILTGRQYVERGRPDRP